jgi:hypothetical protein
LKRSAPSAAYKAFNGGDGVDTNCGQCSEYGKLNMISAARFLGLATVCATFLGVGAWVEPATAQGESCKSDIVTTAGRGKFRPFSKQKELAGEGAAMADAVANWQRQVSDKFGDQWKLWSKAKDTTFDCVPTKGRVFSNLVACTISGRPCLSATALGSEKVAKDDDDADRGKARDKRGRVVGKDRDRIVRYEDNLYEREMAYQRRQEAERHRLENAAYEREMARQKYLAEQRAKAETWAWERENARQRYLAERRKRYERILSRDRDWD